MSGIFSGLESEDKNKLKEKPFPDWMAPQLATLTDERFSDENWIFERKLDGERCLAYIRNGNVILYSRNRKKLNAQYPEIADALSSAAKNDLVIDGEIVAFENGITSFSRLQSRMHVLSEEHSRKSQVKVYYYLFDLLYYDGYDLSEISQRARKDALKKALEYRDPLRYLPHRDKDGEKYFEDACQRGWEGIIAKDASAPYAHRRSRNWLKFKCVQRQELVIGGYTDPEGERIAFGALLLGFYQDGKLRYAGKVGTGFDDRTLRELKKRMEKIGTDQPAFEKDKDLPLKGIHWIRPELVAQIGFEEWTSKDQLRQPRYLGLRDDKQAEDVRKEVAQ